MSKIAKVRVLAMVDGKRREFAPGERLPALAAADIANLAAMGAIEDAPDQDSSERDVADPDGKADAAGGGNAGTNTTASEAAKGSGASPEPGADEQPSAQPDKPKAARARRKKE